MLGDYSEDHPLSIGRSISVCPQHPEHDFPAVVTDISPENIHVEIVNPHSSLPFKTGDVVLVTYWVEEELFYYGPTVLGVSGTNLVLSTPVSKMEVQRRKSYRLGASFPLSYIVIDAAKSDLIGQTVTDCKTQDLSVGGLKFESDLPLEVGDTLAVTLHLSSLPTMKAYGWVVWTKESERDGPSRLVIGLAFLQLGPEEQVQLIHFLAGLQTKDRRLVPRWEASLPCTVKWKDREIAGQIANLSFSGALVTHLKILPPENIEVEIAFQTKDRVTLDARVTSRVVHTQMIAESREVGSFGVTFGEPLDELRPKLTPILRDLFSE